MKNTWKALAKTLEYAGASIFTGRAREAGRIPAVAFEGGFYA